MKTLEQVNEARVKLRAIVTQHINRESLLPTIGSDQCALLAGMLNALVWVADGPDASTMDRLLSGEPLSKGG